MTVDSGSSGGADLSGLSKKQLIAAAASSPVTTLAATKVAYVIYWFKYEYEAGWGVDNEEFEHSIFASEEDARESVLNQFSDGASLSGAGGAFIYPSGPDDTFDVFEIHLPANHRVFEIFGNGYRCTNFGKHPATAEGQMIRKDVTHALDSKSCRKISVPLIGLRPKPMNKERPTLLYSSARDSGPSASVTKLEPKGS